MYSRNLVLLLPLVISLSFYGLGSSIAGRASNCTVSQDPDFCNGKPVVSGDSIWVACNARPIVSREHLGVRQPAARSCRNCAILRNSKPGFQGNCDPSNSKGYKSSTACRGKSYLCVADGGATCYTGSDVVANLGASNGECFS
ncbi:hypothetical protein MMC07_007454 [Pseudocyphellaria aurata]|nr:hypothetical protein [Pseudocyphellaria aurata]